MSSSVTGFQNVDPSNNEGEANTSRVPVICPNSSLAPTSADDLLNIDESKGPSLFQQMATSIKEIWQDVSNNENAILAGKILLVVILMGGLITASVFTCGAALALAGGFEAAATFGWISGTAALFGVGIGLGVSGGIITPLMAKCSGLFDKPDADKGETHLENVGEFLWQSTRASTVCLAYSSAGFLVAVGQGIALVIATGACRSMLESDQN